VEAIPWAEVEAIALAVPEEVRQQLGEFRSRWRAHQVAYPRFAREAAQRAREARQVVESDATDDLSDDQIRDQLSRLRKGRSARINGVRVQKTGTYGRDRRPVFLIGDPIAGGRYLSVIGDKIVPSELRRHLKEMAEYCGLPEVGKPAYDEARLSRDAVYHGEALRAAIEAAALPAEQPSPSVGRRCETSSRSVRDRGLSPSSRSLG
jgi:hypothetical protein